MSFETFSPLANTLVFSSLWRKESDNVKIVFITMLALKGRDHIVRQSAFALGEMCGKTEAEVLEALRVLSEPDKHRLEPQEHEGRRIERVDGVGWMILNGQKYQDEMSKVFRRAANRERMRMKRTLERIRMGRPLPGEEGYVKEAARAGVKAADATLDRKDYADKLDAVLPPDVPFS